MGFIPPDNEDLLSQLTPNEQANYQRWRAAAEEVSNRKPYLDTAVYTRYLHDYLEAGVAHRKHLEGIKTRAADANVPMGPATLKDESFAFVRDFNAEFHNKTLPTFGPQGKEAWAALADKMQPPNLISGGIKQVYDSEEGGLQIGGIIGAIAGYFMASKLTGFSLGGLFSGEVGLFGIIATIVGVGLGAMGGNQIGKWLGGSKDNRTVFPGAGQGRQPERAADDPAPEKGAAHPAPERAAPERDGPAAGGAAAKKPPMVAFGRTYTDPKLFGPMQPFGGVKPPASLTAPMGPFGGDKPDDALTAPMKPFGGARPDARLNAPMQPFSGGDDIPDGAPLTAPMQPFGGPKPKGRPVNPTPYGSGATVISPDGTGTLPPPPGKPAGPGR